MSTPDARAGIAEPRAAIADPRAAVVETAAVAHLVVDVGCGPVRTRGLRYRDRFVLGDAWQISERVHRVDWMVEQPAGPLP